MRMTIPILALSFSLICATAEAVPVKIDGPRIRLADLVGASAGEREIGPAPSPGSRRRVYRREVAHLLGGARSGRLPRHWDVVTNTQELSCKELARRVAAALLPSLRTGLAVTAVSCSRPLILPSGDVRVEAQLGNGTRWAGRLPVTIRVSVGRWPARTIMLQSQVDGVVQAVVASSDLRAGELPAAVRVVSRRASDLAWDAVTSKRELVGMKLTGRVRAGAVIRRGMLTRVPIIKRGAMVTLAVVLRGVQLTSRAVARQDGRRGDTILVLSKATNRLLRARVVSPSRVVVDL